jgi:hypothetical protein
MLWGERRGQWHHRRSSELIAIAVERATVMRWGMVRTAKGWLRRRLVAQFFESKACSQLIL